MKESGRNVVSRIDGCTGPEAKAREALAILMEATGAVEGQLFCLAKGRLKLVASSGEPSVEVRDLRGALEVFLQKEYAGEMITTKLESNSMAPNALRGAAGQAGFEPLALLGKHEGEAVVAGVAALKYTGAARPSLRRATLEALTQALITSDLAEPLACMC